LFSNNKIKNEMKKLFLFMAVTAMTLSSCSKDSGGGSSLSLKVDGVKKSFKVIAAKTAGVVFVEGYIGSASDPTESVSFIMTEGTTGTSAISNFSYDNATDSYSPATTLTHDVTTNSGGSAKGTFSGVLEPFIGTGANITITEGTFSCSVQSE
jgi:hypothetical protein